MGWRRTVSRLVGILRGEARDAELRREIAAHLALIEDEYRREGLSEDEARARARREFGNVTAARERASEAWTFPTIDTVLQDVRYAGRMIRRAPGLSFVIITIVAITIAASTALYTLAEACIMHAIPYPVADRWVVIRARKPEQRTFQNFSSVPELMDLERLTDVFERVGAIIGTGYTASDGEFPEHVGGGPVTASGISMTDVAPILGRTFTEDEDRPGGPHVVVISDEFWQKKYGRDRGVIGRPLKLDGVPRTIIGVMPPHFRLWGGHVWVPMQLDRTHLNRQARQYWIIAVLRRGVTQTMADSRLRLLSEQMAADYRLTDPQYAHQRYETWNILEAVTVGIKPAFFAVSVALVLLLLLACINIATLLLARAVTRGTELSVRAAIGAGRTRLIRQMLTESVVLSCAGGAVGVLLAIWTVPVLFRLVPPDYLSDSVDPAVHVNVAALAVAVGATFATGVLFGALPAFLSSGSNLMNALRTRGTSAVGSRRRLQRVLLVAETALVLVVLASTALTIVSYRRLQMLDLGFAPDHVLTFSYGLPIQVYRDEGTIAAYHADLLARLRRIPGVTAAGETSQLPLGYRMVDITTYDVDIEGHAVPPGTSPDNANFRIVSPGFFEAARTPLVAGRTFTDTDNRTKPAVAIVNETMARRFWPEGAIGRVFRLRERYGRRDLIAPVRSSSAPITVVGVVGDAKQTGVIEAPVRPEFFLALAQRPSDARTMAFMLRTTGDPEAVAGDVRRVVKDVDPGAPISDFKTLDDSIAQSLGARRMTLVLLSFFAVVSLVLAALGLYAATSHGVAQRSREIGIRMALGADASRVVSLIVREGARVTAFGLGAGILASLGATRLISAQLYGVSPADPFVLGTVAVLLGVVSIVAAIIPARRAVKIDPLVAIQPD